MYLICHSNFQNKLFWKYNKQHAQTTEKNLPQKKEKI